MKKRKMYRISQALILVSISLIIFGCSKDRIENPELNSYNSPNEYLDSKKQEEQEYIIDTNGTCPLIAKQGTNLCIAKNCLQLQGGDSVYFPYTLKIVELYTAKDLIYYQMASMSNGSILETEGTIRVRTFKDDKELALRNGCSYYVKMPSNAPKNYMRSFYGFDSSSLIDYTDDPSTLGVSTPYTPVFSDTAQGHSNNIVKFGWLNCGKMHISSSTYQLTFTSTVDDLTNVAIFIYLPATKTIMQVRNLVSDSIPDGAEANIIAIAVKSGINDLYYFNSTITVNASQSIDVTMESTTDADLTKVLDNL